MSASTPPPTSGGSTQAALLQSFTMIILTEIGDKTFLISAILAMRHPRSTVFAGALGSLVVMSALSAGLGSVLPGILPKRYVSSFPLDWWQYSHHQQSQFCPALVTGSRC